MMEVFFNMLLHGQLKSRAVIAYLEFAFSKIPATWNSVQKAAYYFMTDIFMMDILELFDAHRKFNKFPMIHSHQSAGFFTLKLVALFTPTSTVRISYSPVSTSVLSLSECLVPKIFFHHV